MARALDTNIILRWLVRDNAEQVALVDQLLTSGEVFQVSDMAISEMVFVLSKYYELSDHAVVGSVEKILEHKSINCNQALFRRVILDYASSPKVSFVDVCLAHYAGLQNAQLITFDKILAQKLPDLVQSLCNPSST